MISLLCKKCNWTWNGSRYFQNITFTGDPYVVCPGRVTTWHIDIESVLKQKAFTSELGIDWNYSYIAKRDGYSITRGIRVEIDDWLYSNLTCRKGTTRHLFVAQ